MAKALSNSVPQSYRIHLLGEVSGAVVYSRAIFCVLVAAAVTMLCGIADTASAQTCYLPENVADATAEQMKSCFKTILQKDPGKKELIHDNAPCENYYQALLEEARYTRAQNQVRKDTFCKQVSEWHWRKGVFSGTPYWEDCVNAADKNPNWAVTEDQVKRLQACLKGYTDYQKKYSEPVQYNSCSATIEAFEQGWRNGVIEVGKPTPKTNLGCEHFAEVLNRFLSPTPSWIYCTTGHAYYDAAEPERHFFYCMRPSLAELNNCSDAISLYEEKIREANAGVLPARYVKPDCRRVDGFIQAARASVPDAQPAEEPQPDQGEEQSTGAADEAKKPNSVGSSRPSDSYVLIALMLSAFVFLLSQRLAKTQLNKHGYKTNAFQSDIAEIVRTFAIFFSVLSLTSLLQRATGIDLLTPFTAIINLYRSSIEALIPDFLWNIGLPKWYADLVSFSLIAASPRLRNALDFAFFHDRRENEIWTDHEVAVRYMNFYHPGFSLVHFLEMDKDEDPVALDPRSKFVSDALTTLLTALLGLSWLLTIKRNFHNTFWLSKIYKYHLFTEWESSELRDGRQTIPGGLVGWFHLKYVWLPMILPPLITAMIFYATRVFA